MTSHVLEERSVVLRLEFSIADAVHQRGLLPVIAAALQAWWQRPRGYAQVPDYLREDLGLPPAENPVFYPLAAPLPAPPLLLGWKQT